jgi:hypothetical protein
MLRVGWVPYCSDKEYRYKAKSSVGVSSIAENQHYRVETQLSFSFRAENQLYRAETPLDLGRIVVLLIN